MTNPRVLIVGGGFGGLTLAQRLRRAPAEILLIDRSNYQLFQPLLYQVAAAALSPAEIAQPLRSILRAQPNVAVQMEEVTGADLAGREIRLADGRRVHFDMLVIATGVEYSYFGHPEWQALAPSLKSIADATDIRRRLLLSFEKAEATPDAGERRALLTFVLVGGGPTGVELAGSIAELAHHALRRDFRNIDPRSARIVLAEAGSRLLPGFHPDASAYAKRSLESMGVEVLLDTRIESVEPRGVATQAGFMEASLVLWCAGVQGTPAACWLGVQPDRYGCIAVAPDLSLPSWPDVFVIGDLAAATDRNGQRLPQTAAVAKQQARHVAAVIRARLAGRPPPERFEYHDPGMLAIIGRKAAVVDFGTIRLTGFIGWLVWGFAHIFFLIGFRNRVAVFLQWMWEWATYSRGARLIVEYRRDAR